MSFPALDLANNWQFTEIWVDPTSVPPYILMLLGDDKNNFCILDPTENYRNELQFLSYNSFRNKIIQTTCNNFRNNVLILLNNIDHGQHLYDLLSQVSVFYRN